MRAHQAQGYLAGAAQLALLGRGVRTVGQRALHIPVGEADGGAPVGRVLLQGAVGEGHHAAPIAEHALALAVRVPHLLRTGACVVCSADLPQRHIIIVVNITTIIFNNM